MRCSTPLHIFRDLVGVIAKAVIAMQCGEHLDLNTHGKWGQTWWYNDSLHCMVLSPDFLCLQRDQEMVSSRQKYKEEHLKPVKVSNGLGYFPFSCSKRCLIWESNPCTIGRKCLTVNFSEREWTCTRQRHTNAAGIPFTCLIFHVSGGSSACCHCWTYDASALG